MMEEEEEMGTGVRLRVKGFEEEDIDERVVLVLAIETVVEVEVVLSVEDWRDLRRKGTEGIR